MTSKMSGAAESTSCDNEHGCSVATAPEDERVVVGDVSDCPSTSAVQYEYLDHTADVQLHAWGDSLSTAFEQCAQAMFAYMTEIDSVGVQYTFDITAQGDDVQSLLFHFLDEWLFAFSAEPFFIPRVIRVLSFDRETWQMTARGWGESFDLAKHPQGTEVKAITYSNMQIHEPEDTAGDGKTEVFVIIDI